MPTTSDLIDLLRERSEHPPASAGLDGLHRRIGRRRVARSAVVAVAAVALAAVALVPAVRGGGPGTGLGGEPPAPYAGALQLVAAQRASVPDESTFSYTFTPTSYEFEFGLLCAAGPTGRVEASVNGRPMATQSCSTMGPDRPFEQVVHIDPPVLERHRWRDYGVVLNQPLTVTVTVVAGAPPMTEDGYVTLLVYGPAPHGDYPREVSAPPGTTLINSVDALAWGTNESHHMLFSVRKVPGRHIAIIVEAYGKGEVAVYANGAPQRSLKFQTDDLSNVVISIDPAKVAPEVPDGEEFTVGVDTRGFAAPLWRISALDTPPGKPFG
jgi:hypothetical protein